MKHFALLGNPNCGKTTLFNSLTGSTAYVGNWAGVTVEKKMGTYKKDNIEVSLVDLPGIYSLSPYTQEEVITRNYIIEEKPDCVINVVDATNLERNLYLTTQLLEMDIPVVIAVNMIDALKQRGEEIDIPKLEKELKVKIVSVSALKQEHLDDLMVAADMASQHERRGFSVISTSLLKDVFLKAKEECEENGITHPSFHAVKILENDDIEINQHQIKQSLIKEGQNLLKGTKFENDVVAFVADARYQYIEVHLSIAQQENKLSYSDRIDKVLTHKWFGIPIFIAVLFLMFHFVFSENLFFLGGLINSSSFEGTLWEGLFWTNNGINSIGVIFQRLITIVSEIIVGLVHQGLSNATPWVEGFLADGVLAGVFSVLTFVPQILLLFLFFSILEDSGYMARIAFILDRILRKFGVSGRSLMPMIMGFGCSVPAMMNTRSLASEKEKIMTIRVIPFFSCGAKLPILTGIAGAIVSSFGIGNADLITLGMYVLGISSAMIAIYVMNNTTMKGDVAPFIMELPSYHLPQAKSLMYHMWDKLKHFLIKAFTVILASTIIIWAISHFSFSFKYLEDANINQSMLATLGSFLQPLFTPLGFGSQLSQYGWIFIVSIITGLIAKENVIATLGTVACSLAIGSDSSTAICGLIGVTGITIPALLAFIAFNMMTIPCVGAVSAAKTELRIKPFIFTLLFWIGASYLISSMIYTIGTWWWTSFIWMGILIISVLTIFLFNKFSTKEQSQ
ncbi:MAG: ferrous iron transport protein B [Bacilli bacterium]|nr:ferrous iron transport protein B [Bacilli bacterium]